jgi:syntaxin 5
MVCLDRTAEFSALRRKFAPQAPLPEPARTVQPTSELTGKSSDISIEIDAVRKRLGQLTKLAKGRGIFNDKTSEIEQITMEVKNRIAELNRNVEVLDASMSGGTAQQRKHASTIVDTLKHRLMELTKDFKDALQSRTKAMQEQDARRSKYSRASPTAYQPIGNYDPELGGVGDGGGGGSLQKSFHVQREQGVQGVQKVIGELATMFQKMATMVNQQEEMIQRIDHDVDDSLANVERGQNELLKYYHNISSNRPLILKILFILVFFVIFFIVFIA